MKDLNLGNDINESKLEKTNNADRLNGTTYLGDEVLKPKKKRKKITVTVNIFWNLFKINQTIAGK